MKRVFDWMFWLGGLVWLAWLVVPTFNWGGAGRVLLLIAGALIWPGLIGRSIVRWKLSRVAADDEVAS